MENSINPIESSYDQITEKKSLSAWETLEEAWGYVGEKGVKLNFFLCLVISLILSGLILFYILSFALLGLITSISLDNFASAPNLSQNPILLFISTTLSIIYGYIWLLPLLTISFFIVRNNENSLKNLKYIFNMHVLLKCGTYVVFEILLLLPTILPFFLIPSSPSFTTNATNVSALHLSIIFMSTIYKLIVSMISGVVFWIFYFLVLDKFNSGQECKFFTTLKEAFLLLFKNFWYITVTTILIGIINFFFVILTLGIGIFWALPFAQITGMLMYDKIKDRN